MKFQYLKIFQRGQFSETDIDRFLASAKEMVLSMDPKWTVKLSAARHYPTRTLPLNGYYWVLMTIYGDHVGMSKKEADLWWKSYLMPTRPVVNQKSGEQRMVPISTSDMNTQELTKYIEDIKREAMIQDEIYLPEPGEAIQMAI